MITLEDYKQKLSRHDWFYDWSDDGRVWRKGETEKFELVQLARANGDAFKIAYNQARQKHFPNSPKAFPISEPEFATLADDGAENPKQTNTQNNTMTKLTDILCLLAMAFIHGIIAAGQHLQSGADSGAFELTETTATGGDGEPTTATVATPGKRGRKPGAAVAVAAAAAEEPAADELTAEKLRDMATPLVQASRGAEVKALAKKYGAESIGQLDPKHYKAFATGIEALLM